MTREAYEQIAGKVVPGSRLLRIWELEGGVSAQVTGLEIEKPDGQLKKLIVRRHGAADLARNPHVAADEFHLLKRLHAAGLPVPEPYAADESGGILPSPYVVIAFIEGREDFAPSDPEGCSMQLADHLAGIHQVDIDAYQLQFLPKQDEIYAGLVARRPVRLDKSLDEGRIRDSLERVWPLPRVNRIGLLHGDYWPGNILWKDGRLAAVIDWEDAALGDPLADFANAGLEILFAFGEDAMTTFRRRYMSRMTALDYANLPYWELCAALRPASKLSEWGLDAETEKRMRERHKRFVNRIFDELSR
ncbi:phosphotransferase family protein [Paenibacillus harenae]|uniref:phosphotransferase family protein n=1 Tax=Paenibacillus harenae TaxID=306543 RepID=UPI0004211812|nr:phosphotransferase family protein [Paenibacillus harenae]